jgi:hypothetical protein
MSGPGPGAPSPSRADLQIVVQQPNPDRRFVLVVPPLQAIGPTGSGRASVSGSQAGAPSALQPGVNGGDRSFSHLQTEAAWRSFIVGQISHDGILADLSGPAPTNLSRHRVQQRPGTAFVMTYQAFVSR